MLKSVLGALVKMIKIEILYWEIVKSEEFKFLKVKTLLYILQNEYSVKRMRDTTVHKNKDSQKLIICCDFDANIG